MHGVCFSPAPSLSLSFSHPRSYDGARRVPSPGPLSFFGLLLPLISQQCTVHSICLSLAPSHFLGFFPLSRRCASSWPLAPSPSSCFSPLSRRCASPWHPFLLRASLTPISWWCTSCTSRQPPLLRAFPPYLTSSEAVSILLDGWTPLLRHSPIHLTMVCIALFPFPSSLS